MTVSAKYGQFGKLSAIYDLARPPMPDEVLDYLISNTKPSANVLDIGCGTGIVTRQLKARGLRAVGSDIDSEMIKVARSHNDAIEYVIAPAERLPFADGSFDGVTSFSAFHWFANEQAVAEMRRVAPGGIVFVANREHGSFRKGFLDVLVRFMETEPPNIKAYYDPKRIMESNGYQDVTEEVFQLSEQLTIEDSVEYVQSTSLWNLVPREKKHSAENAINTYFQSISTRGIVLREVEIRTLLGRN